MIKYLKPEQVLVIHNRLLEETGGLHGVRDLSMWLSALGRPQATIDRKDHYVDLFSKGAAFPDALIRNHPFSDGNNRTAIVATGPFLRINGYSLEVKNDEMVRFTLICAQSQVNLEEISIRIKEYTV